MAKVSNAATAAASPDLQWFKISEDGFNTQNLTWGVDHMVANKGWNYFKIPTCIAPGNYLMRVELIGMLPALFPRAARETREMWVLDFGRGVLTSWIVALHSAYSSGGAQFYLSCAQVNVVGSTGTVSPATVKLPGAYPQNDP